MLAGIFAQSADSVYAIGNGGRQDEGGPLVILHWNGHQWSKVAGGNFGFGTQPLQQARHCVLRPCNYRTCGVGAGLLAGCNAASVPAWQRTGGGT